MVITSEHIFRCIGCMVESHLRCYRLPLEGMKRKVLRNLRLLESDNLVSSSDDYQDIINAIAKVVMATITNYVFRYFYT